MKPWQGMALMSVNGNGMMLPRVLLPMTMEKVEHEAKEKEGEVEELERLSVKMDEAVLANQCEVQTSVLCPPALGWT